jgi:hypothetical protein
MYFSTLLASQTLMSISQIWSSYNALNSVLSGVISYFTHDTHYTDDFYGEKERKEHLITCVSSLATEVEKLSQLYPAENLRDIFTKTSNDIQGIHHLLSEFDLKKIIYLPGINNNDALQSQINNLNIFSLSLAIAEHIQTTTPLSGLQAKLVTSALVEQNPQAAIQQIFTLFEDYLRKRIGKGSDTYGETLINAAFAKDGALKYGETPAEQMGVRNLFSGMYAVFRNPHMHRIVNEDQATVLAIITTVDLLIKIIDEAKDIEST